MKKQYILLAIILALTLSGLYAQDRKTPGTAHDNVFYPEVYEVYKNIGVQMKYVPVGDYTASSLYYRNTAGDLRQGQEAESVQHVGISTRGLYRGKKIMFFGGIDIRKEYMDDQGWGLSYGGLRDGVMEDPHYLAVARPANWSNQYYELGGGFTLPVIADRLDVSLEAEYDAFNKYRTDLDPRTEVTYNRLHFKTTVGYTFLEKHQLSAGGALGYFHVSNSAKFNNNGANIPYNYDRYIRWVTGYGTMANSASHAIKRRNTHWSVVAGYSYQDTGWRLLCQFRYSGSRTDTFKDNSDDRYASENIYGIYHTDEMENNLMLLRFPDQDRAFKVHLSGIRRQGDNFLTAKDGKNYTMEQTKLGLGASLIRYRDTRIRYDTGMTLTYLGVQQQDRLSQTATDNSLLHAQLYFLKDYILNNSMILTPGIKGGYRHTLDNMLANGSASYLGHITESDYAGLALKRFYEDVVYHDHEIWSQNVWLAGAGVDLRFRKIRNFDLTLRIRTEVQQAVQTGMRRWTTGIAVVLDY